MNSLNVGTTPIKLIDSGNRDFIHIYNNGSEPIFLMYDGGPDPTAADITFRDANTYGQGLILANNQLSVPTFLTSAQMRTILSGMKLSSNSSPNCIQESPPIRVKSVDPIAKIITFDQPVTIINNGFDGSSDSWTLSSKLSVSNGFPIAPGTWYNLDNDGHRNLFNKAVWAIAAAGPVDVRVQGA